VAESRASARCSGGAPGHGGRREWRPLGSGVDIRAPKDRSPRAVPDRIRFDARLRRERPAGRSTRRTPRTPSMIARNLAALLFLAALVRPAGPLALSRRRPPAWPRQQPYPRWSRAGGLRPPEGPAASEARPVACDAGPWARRAPDRALDEWLAKGSSSPRGAAARQRQPAPSGTRPTSRAWRRRAVRWSAGPTRTSPRPRPSSSPTTPSRLSRRRAATSSRTDAGARRGRGPRRACASPSPSPPTGPAAAGAHQGRSRSCAPSWTRRTS
jgi:hypothetical protein